MTKQKLTTAIATDMVTRIEALHGQIAAIYAEADMKYDGRGNSSALKDAIRARSELREAEYNAGALLESFDAELTEED